MQLFRNITNTLSSIIVIINDHTEINEESTDKITYHLIFIIYIIAINPQHITKVIVLKCQQAHPCTTPRVDSITFTFN